MKKALLLLLIALGVLPAISRNFSYEYEGQTLIYTVISEEEKTCKTRDGYNDKNNVLRAGNPVEGDLMIPAVAKDGDVAYTVTTVGYCSFYQCGGLESVIFPPTLLSIDNNAFDSCTMLESLTIPGSVLSIGNQAFEACKGLTTVTIQDAPLSIGNQAFWNCTALSSLDLGESVTSIGDHVFAGCSPLASVTIPSSVSKIGRQAFRDCSNLKEVTISDSSVSLDFGILVFQNSGIETLYLGRNIACETDTYTWKPFCNRPNLTSLTIGDMVTEIDGSAFRECEKLESVVIPNSVTSIGGSAFSRCSALKSVKIGDGVTSIGSSAFYVCSSLTSLSLGKSVQTIGNSAFQSANLSSLIIPNSVTEIESSAFKNCLNLRELTLEDGVEVLHLNSYVFESVPLETLYLGREFQYTSPVGSAPFQKGSLKSLTIGNMVTSIGSGAFRNCKGLETLTIPNSITSIGSKAFYNCTGLVSLTLPDQLAILEESAFYGCSGLSSLNIPESVESIGKSAFNGCTSLKDVYYPAPTPIEGDASIFSSATYNAATLWVDEMAEPICQELSPWKNFKSRKQLASIGIDSIETDSQSEIDWSEPYTVYDSNGIKIADSIEMLSSGTYVVRQGGATKKIAVN